MKAPLKWILSCTILALAGTAFGQADYGTLSGSTRERNRDRDTTATTTRDASESQNFLKSKSLVGANIKDSQGEKLGDISELYVNPKSGDTFASVGISGDRHALVPVQAFTVTRSPGMLRNAEVTLNTTKEKLESGPSIAGNEWNQLDRQEFVQSIYTHYNVQPSAMGGTDDLEGTSSGSSMKHKEHKEHMDMDKEHKDTEAKSDL